MAKEVTFDVFLSHSSVDKSTVRAIAQRLSEHGFKVWFDEWEIKAGDNIPIKIENGLRNSRLLVRCVSSHGLSSDWATLEYQTFVVPDPLNKKARYVALRLDDTPIDGSMAQFRYLSWAAGGTDEEFALLLDFCKRVVINGKPTRRLIFDESHRQAEWRGFPICRSGYSKIANEDLAWEVEVAQKGGQLPDLLAASSGVLILPTPFGTKVDLKEYRQISECVNAGNGLMLLGIYLMESHHFLNANQLAGDFAMELSHDLVMPLSNYSFESCLMQSMGTHAQFTSTIVPVSAPVEHPIVSGVNTVAFQSSCTVLAGRNVDVSLWTKEALSVMNAIGPKGESGQIRQVQDYVLSKQTPVRFMAGTSFGKGRVAVFGSWKIFLNEFTEDSSLDNLKLFNNTISWLDPNR